MVLQPGSRPVPNSSDYVLIRKLGAGAFGEVWHAHGPGGLDVALKFIANVPAHELRSLDAMKGIRHPNLVSLFGAWHKDNRLILAMELCDRSLQDRLIETRRQDLPGIPQNELLPYMSDAANGLDHMNAKGTQHRDIKPANLLLLGTGVKIADFGLAKALEQTIATNSGAGTFAYTAPECFQGKLTQQSDLYSLAVTYYHLRTGRLLFDGDAARMMYAHLEVEPDLSQLPATERGVLARALAKEPKERWGSCKMFLDGLVAANNLQTARWSGKLAEFRQVSKHNHRIANSLCVPETDTRTCRISLNPIIKRGTKIPCSFTKTYFPRTDPVDRIVICAYLGDYYDNPNDQENLMLFTIPWEFHPLRPRRDGAIEVTFEVGADDGMVSVQFHDLHTGQKRRFGFQPSIWT